MTAVIIEISPAAGPRIVATAHIQWWTVDAIDTDGLRETWEVDMPGTPLFTCGAAERKRRTAAGDPIATIEQGPVYVAGTKDKGPGCWREWQQADSAGKVWEIAEGFFTCRVWSASDRPDPNAFEWEWDVMTPIGLAARGTSDLHLDRKLDAMARAQEWVAKCGSGRPSKQGAP